MKPERIEMIEPEGDALALQPIGEATPRALAVAQPQSPMAMMLQAQAQGISMETLDRMWSLQVKFDEREAEKAHNEAFASFKSEAVRIIKNRLVDNGPLKGKKYAELFAVNNAATGPLAKHGLSTYWKVTKDEPEWIEVTCYLKHSGGHVQSVSMGGPPDIGGAKSPMQARASTVSYLERYTLKAILGLAEQDEDDDANPHGGTADDKAFELRDDWIERVQAGISEAVVMRTWKLALAEIEPLNRMDVYGAIKAAVTAKCKQLRGEAE